MTAMAPPGTVPLGWTSTLGGYGHRHPAVAVAEQRANRDLRSPFLRGPLQGVRRAGDGARETIGKVPAAPALRSLPGRKYNKYPTFPC